VNKVPKKKVSVNFSHALFYLLDFFTLEDGTVGCPKTSVRNYHSTLRNNTKEQKSHMMIWRGRPWFGSAWLGSEQSGSALHEQI